MSNMLTPPPTQKSRVVYKWVILFLYCEDTEFPFSCVSLASLENSNFPFNVRKIYNSIINSVM